MVIENDYWKHPFDLVNTPEYVLFAEGLEEAGISEIVGYGVLMRLNEETRRNAGKVQKAVFLRLIQTMGVDKETTAAILEIGIRCGSMSEDGNAVAGGFALESLEEIRHLKKTRSECGRRGGLAKASNAKAKAGKPVAKAGKPVAKAGKPVAKAGKPVAKAGKPKHSNRDRDRDSNITSTNVDVCSERLQANGTEPAAIVELSEFSLELNTGEAYQIPKADLEEYRRLYPAVDVEQELRNMAGWLMGNPAKRKTRRGIGAFITSWFGRVQDRGGTSQQRKVPTQSIRREIPKEYTLPPKRREYTLPEIFQE